MKTALLFSAAIAPVSWAFLDTVPVVAWASHPSDVLDALSAPGLPPSLDVLLSDNASCDFDALVLVEHPGVRPPLFSVDVVDLLIRAQLHAADLRLLAPSSALPSRLRTAAHTAQRPYIRSSPDLPLPDAAAALARRCGAQLSWGQLPALNPAHKHVVCISLPPVEGLGAWRKDAVAAHESTLANTVSAIESAFARHLVVYTGVHTSPHDKRQLASSFEDVSSPALSTSAQNSTLPTGGILKRYQLLTPAIITSLLIVFAVIVPMIMMGINALAGIQSPVRLDAAPKVGHDKKTQ